MVELGLDKIIAWLNTNITLPNIGWFVAGFLATLIVWKLINMVFNKEEKK